MLLPLPVMSESPTTMVSPVNTPLFPTTSDRLMKTGPAEAVKWTPLELSTTTRGQREDCVVSAKVAVTGIPLFGKTTVRLLVASKLVGSPPWEKVAPVSVSVPSINRPVSLPPKNCRPAASSESVAPSIVRNPLLSVAKVPVTWTATPPTFNWAPIPSTVSEPFTVTVPTAETVPVMRVLGSTPDTCCPAPASTSVPVPAMVFPAATRPRVTRVSPGRMVSVAPEPSTRVPTVSTGMLKVTEAPPGMKTESEVRGTAAVDQLPGALHSPVAAPLVKTTAPAGAGLVTLKVGVVKPSIGRPWTARWKDAPALLPMSWIPKKLALAPSKLATGAAGVRIAFPGLVAMVRFTNALTLLRNDPSGSVTCSEKPNGTALSIAAGSGPESANRLHWAVAPPLTVVSVDPSNGMLPNIRTTRAFASASVSSTCSSLPAVGRLLNVIARRSSGVARPAPRMVS